MKVNTEAKLDNLLIVIFYSFLYCNKLCGGLYVTVGLHWAFKHDV